MTKIKNKGSPRLARRRRAPNLIVAGWDYDEADRYAQDIRLASKNLSLPWKCEILGCNYEPKNQRHFDNFKKHVRTHVELSYEEKVRMGLICNIGECRETFHSYGVLTRHKASSHRHDIEVGESTSPPPTAQLEDSTLLSHTANCDELPASDLPLASPTLSLPTVPGHVEAHERLGNFLHATHLPDAPSTSTAVIDHDGPKSTDHHHNEYVGASEHKPSPPTTALTYVVTQSASVGPENSGGVQSGAIHVIPLTATTAEGAHATPTSVLFDQMSSDGARFPSPPLSDFPILLELFNQYIAYIP